MQPISLTSVHQMRIDAARLSRRASRLLSKHRGVLLKALPVGGACRGRRQAATTPQHVEFYGAAAAEVVMLSSVLLVHACICAGGLPVQTLIPTSLHLIPCCLVHNTTQQQAAGPLATASLSSWARCGRPASGPASTTWQPTT